MISVKWLTWLALIASLFTGVSYLYAAKKPKQKHYSAQQRRQMLLYSLEKERLIYLDRMEDLDQEIAIFKSKKKLSDQQLVRYYRLLNQKEHFQYALDSLKLAAARRYKRSELTEKAEGIYTELLKSNYSAIRKTASVDLDSIVREKKSKFYEKWPVQPVVDLGKPVIPCIGLLVLLGFVYWIINKSKNKNYLDVACNDEQEAAAFKLAIRTMLDTLRQRANQTSGGALPPGGAAVLPHLLIDNTTGIANAVEAIVSDSYLKFFALISKWGLKPRYSLNIFIEKGTATVQIKANFKIDGQLVLNWDNAIQLAQLFDERLDIAFAVLIKIQTNP